MCISVYCCMYVCTVRSPSRRDIHAALCLHLCLHLCLESEEDGSLHVGPGNQTWVLCNKWSQPSGKESGREDCSGLLGFYLSLKMSLGKGGRENARSREGDKAESGVRPQTKECQQSRGHGRAKNKLSWYSSCLVSVSSQVWTPESV